MIEIFRKGFRLDIPSTQIVTFKKAQNLNGVQERYSYSNTISLEKTANIKKLLDLTDLPMGKAQTMQNGFEVDIVLNGSIQLRNQILKITKDTPTKVDLYIVYSESSLITKLKNTYINDVVEGIKYKKTRDDFAIRANFFNFDPITPSVFVQTQSSAGVYVVEEMPILINLQWLMSKVFTDLGYEAYGDFFKDDNTIKEYYIAPNQGVYQVYSGSGAGFSPAFDANFTAFDLLNQTLAYFNCYLNPDDTYHNVTINSWANLSNYKNNYKDYSRFYVNYQDNAFQSKLAKRNELKYSESEQTFDSYFSNPLSSEESATYLDSKFGSGSTMLFSDSELNDDGSIEVRGNGELGESSAVRIYKISPDYNYYYLYENGQKGSAPVQARKAVSVSMREVYNSFHKGYTDFILTPLIQNVIFRYDDILATDFSMTTIFFIEQLASYWIPLEINFSTKKDQIIVKCMLVKRRKVVSPILNNFNSVLIDFRQRVSFPLEYLLSMYSMPPNQYPWTEIIFKSYDQNKNTLIVNGVVVPAESLPQSFPLAGISIEFEGNKPGDTIPDKLTDSLYIQAIDSNGGLSNEAYITLKHTGVASLESNFTQMVQFTYSMNNVDDTGVLLNALSYITGPKPNINNTITSIAPGEVPSTPELDAFNMIVAIETYNNVSVKTSPFSMRLVTRNNGDGIALVIMRLMITYGTNGTTEYVAGEFYGSGNSDQTFNVTAKSRNIPTLTSGQKVRVFLWADVKNLHPSNAGNVSFDLYVNGMSVAISTIKNY